jgi:glutathione S-transferase
MSELKSIFDKLELEMLENRKFVAGDTMTIADINVVFVVRWALVDLQFEKVPGFGAPDLPRIYAWYVRGLSRQRFWSILLSYMLTFGL